MKVSRKSFFYKIAYWYWAEDKKPSEANLCQAVKYFFIGLTFAPIFILIADVFAFLLFGRSVLYTLCKREKESILLVPYCSWRNHPIPPIILGILSGSGVIWGMWSGWVTTNTQQHEIAIVALVLGSFLGIAAYYLHKVWQSELKREVLNTWEVLLFALKGIKEKTCFKIDYVD